MKLTNIAMIAAVAGFISACASGVSEDQVADAANKQWDALVKSMPPSDDPAYRERTQRIAGRLLTAAGEDPTQWRVEVFEQDKVINAFALPNRSIGVFTGILDVVENDDQLAAVIGHEIAHVDLRHAEARLNSNVGPRILINAAQLPGAIVDVGAVKTVGAIASAPIAAGSTLPFNRNQELDADIEGLRLMAQAGYDPHAAAAFWRKISTSEAQAGAPPEFLSTHPSRDRRIEQLEEAAAAL